MRERLLRGGAAALTVLVTWWLAFGVTAIWVMAEGAATAPEPRSRFMSALREAILSPADSFELVTYWGTAWLLSMLGPLIVAIALAIIAATARSRRADRTPIVITSKTALVAGTLAMVFLVSRANAAYGADAATHWLDWAAAFCIALFAAVGVGLGVRALPRSGGSR